MIVADHPAEYQHLSASRRQDKQVGFFMVF